jgi:hypothetical protein
MNKTNILAILLLLPLAGACDRADSSSQAQAQPTTSAEQVAVAEEAAPAAEEEQAAPSGPAPTQTTEDGARLFGDELSDREAVPLATLMESPADYDGQTVRTEGIISAVCQRMGCWMELKAEEDGPAIRVPMAGHSFFLPRDVSGARATIEGTVEVRELPPDWQEHLREEGAQAADQALGINATGVLIHAG